MDRRSPTCGSPQHCWDLAFAGFALRVAAYVPTTEPATVLDDALNGAVQVLGTLTWSAAVGDWRARSRWGLAAREGARIVSKYDPGRGRPPGRAGRSLPAGTTPPMSLALRRDLAARASRWTRCQCWTSPAGRWPPRGKMLRLAARHQLHGRHRPISPPGSPAVADAAVEAGVRHVMIAHPESRSRT